MNIWIIVILILFILRLTQDNRVREYFMKEPLQSAYDRRTYNIVKKFPDKKVAVEKMAIIHNFMIDFLRHMKTKYIVNKKGNYTKQMYAAGMIKNYNPDNLFENDPVPGSETSYVTAKGTEFGLCLREKQSGSNNFHDIELVKFVALHELTHLGNPTFGHDKGFWQRLQWATQDAEEAGIYSPIDYSKYPTKYCGVDVTFNPYYEDYNNNIRYPYFT
jgi:hypothetical protein